MPRHVTLIAALLAVLAVAGCSTSGRTDSQRRTVPVRHYDLDHPVLFDPAFDPATLRAVDPCATLRAAGLDRYGKPARDTTGALGACSNFMKDRNGKDFNLTLSFEGDLSDGSKHLVGGLPTDIAPSEGGCFVRSAYRGGAGPPFGTPKGMVVQLSTETADPCSPAVEIMSDVVRVLRSNPPIGGRASGSLGAFDPCAMIDPAAARDAAAGASSRGEPDGIYACDWQPDNGVELHVEFTTGAPEPGSLPPADIGGAQASVTPSADMPSCRVEWEHRRNANSVGDSELVRVSVTNSNKLPLDPCANAVNLARTVRPKLPTA
ncbi:DUF3558 domain-containing protein [Saccharopolyspora rosea]|uniref:hypothetical protein n=1 Tax=Saccharopolyspora rosea TaxID=524884 RepID=UPI0021D9EDA3|nr:hypothetical protein [Saccharopolyspora rosea]